MTKNDQLPKATQRAGRHAKGYVRVRVTTESRNVQYHAMTIPPLLAQIALREPYYYQATIEDDGRIVFTPKERIVDDS